MEFGKSARASLVYHQRAEATRAMVYAAIALREKDPNNRNILDRMASEERMHADILGRYTKLSVRPDMLKVRWYLFLSRVFGYTFVAKLLEVNEFAGIKSVSAELAGVPEIGKIIKREERHERMLRDMLDEERLKYVGAIVLGMNDAIVEFTGVIVGLSFALASARVVMLTVAVAGISAGLSMAASNYLAEKAEGNPKALKAGFYTGVAYLSMVALIVFPYTIFPDSHIKALGLIFAITVSVMFLLNYYISVAKSLPLARRFFEMVAISIGVSAVAFGIGQMAKLFLGVDL